VFLKVILNSEVLDRTPSRIFKSVVSWAATNVFDDNILTVENWLELAFHLNKQRWGASIDWLETQPMSKIKTMIEINKKHAEEQESQVKKASRKK
jgi:hypothetical protein